MSKVILVNGPSIYLDVNRGSDICETNCIKEIEKRVSSVLCKRGIYYESIHTNLEEEIIVWLKKQRNADFLLLNPGSLANTSLGLREVVIEIKMPFLEVHLTYNFSCEESIYYSLFSDISVGTLVGLGIKGYFLASEFAADFLEQDNKK